MNKKIWNIYAPIYEKAMRKDRQIYEYMYERIPTVIQNKDVLEIATGPGLLAKYVAHSSKKMIATDYAPNMIEQAKKGDYPNNLSSEVADATSLPYSDDSFDVVLIANALHVMPDPEKALQEIDRVLKPHGLLIAPNFIEHNGKLWAWILKLAGISFEHQWSKQEYEEFLRKNGWQVQLSKKMEARIPIVYVECKRIVESKLL